MSTTIRWWFIQSAIAIKHLPFKLQLRTFTKNVVMSRKPVRVMKPPNIMVFTSNDTALYEKCKKALQGILHPDCYVIYPLNRAQIKNKEPWQDNTTLLVVRSRNLLPNEQSEFMIFFQNGGRLLSLGSDLILPGVKLTPINPICIPTWYKSWSNEFKLQSESFQIAVEPGFNCVLASDSSDNPLIVELKSDKNGTAVLNQINILREETILLDLLSENFKLNCRIENKDTELTTAYVTSKNSDAFSEASNYFKSISKDNLLTLKNAKFNFTIDDALPNVYNVKFCSEFDQFESDFDLSKYFFYLTTERLGHSVIYSKIVNSTMDFIEGLQRDLGLAVICQKQVGGKGRGGNKWLSPGGCAMFSCQMSFELSSPLGQAIPFLQHLVALAVVNAVRSQPGYESIEINLKWPNDIYVGKQVKIGGVLANSTLNGRNVLCSIGCGVNLDNAFPTACINSLIDEKELPKLSREWLIANSLNQLETLVSEFQIKGANSCLELYYRYWIHTDQELVLGQTGETICIKGIDEFGFLEVENKNGTRFSLQPDGNSLDMMKNHIMVKN